MDPIKQLESPRNAVLQQITQIGDLRPDNLSAFHRKCYKPNCHCAKPGDAGHSSWQLTRKDENQKTIRHSIPKRSLEETRKQVAEYSRFQALVKRFAEIKINCARPAFEPVRLKKNSVIAISQDGFAAALEAAGDVASLLQSQAGADAIDLEALEVAVKAKMMDLGSALLSAHINADRRDGDADQLRCQCGAQAKRCGRRERNLISALGVLRLKRSYYHCDACSGGFFPKDRSE